MHADRRLTSADYELLRMLVRFRCRIIEVMHSHTFTYMSADTLTSVRLAGHLWLNFASGYLTWVLVLKLGLRSHAQCSALA